MKPKDIIKYMNACGKIKEAVVAETYSKIPNNVRIFNHPFDENSKSYVIGLGQRKKFRSSVKNPWDYCITNKILKRKQKKVLEDLIKNMGPISDIF